MKTLNNTIDFELNITSNFILQKSNSIDSLLTTEGQIGFDSSPGVKKIKYYNGTSVVSLPLTTDLSAYLPLSGGTMTGDIAMTPTNTIKSSLAPNNYVRIGASGFEIYGGNSDVDITSEQNLNLTALQNINITTHPDGIIYNDGTDFAILQPSTITLQSIASDKTIQLIANSNHGIIAQQTTGGFSHYLAFPVISTNYTATLPQASGTIALTSDISAAVAGYLPLGGGTMSGLIVLSGDPIASMGAATKNYVDNFVNGLSWKQSVVAATTANITLSGTQTIDGISVIAGNRVLVKNQSTASQNGIYVAASGSWSRAEDNDTGTEIANTTVLCEAGVTNGGTQWNCSNSTITLGSTSITFVKIAGAGVYTNGTGLSLTGNTFSIDSTVVTLTDTQTLTNKTITNPRMTNILTAYGNYAMGFVDEFTSVQPVNQLYITNAGIAGSGPKLSVGGPDTNINLRLESWGSDSSIVISTTTSLKLPNGTSAQRNATPANGMIRYNTTNNKYEGYENGQWRNIATTTGQNMVVTIGQNYALSKGYALN